MDSTLNEIVHECNRLQLSTGKLLITYEPVENLPIGTLMGKIRSNKRTIAAMSGTFCEMNNRIAGKIIPVQGSLLEHGLYSPFTGIIKLMWLDDPGEHYLSLCYKFGNDVKWKLNSFMPCNVNWKMEGF